MAEVFISYAREDCDPVERLVGALAAAGVDCWWDRQLCAGIRFAEDIEANLRAAKAVVVIWTRHSVASNWVVDEACVGRDTGRLVPITFDRTPPPLGFRQYHVIDFSPWLDGDSRPVGQLMAAIEQIKARAQRASTSPPLGATDQAIPAPGDTTVVAAASDEGVMPHAVLRRPAVAVLPFVNLSGDPGQEYFVDGMTEDLITALSAWRWFPVIARNSTFVYKGRAVDMKAVGRDLGARYLVEGSVRRAGDRVRISAKLVEAETAETLWAQTADRELGDVFALQDEITRAMMAAIEPRLSQAEQQRALRKQPGNLDAWDLSLQAMAEIRRGTLQSLTRAEQLLTRAVALDGRSSYSQSLLALARFQGALFGWLNDPTRSLLSTYEAALEAVALDDGDWLAHALLGLATLWCHGDYDRATDEVGTAIALNPSAAMAYHFSGCVLTFNDQPAAALTNLLVVPKLDPRFPLLPSTLADIALANFLLGNFDDAVRYCQRALGEQRDHVRAWQRLAAIYGTMGRSEEASTAFGQVMRLMPQFDEGYLATTYPFRNREHADLLRHGLRQAGWSG